MWSSKTKEQKIIGETNDSKLITFSEILTNDDEIDINILKSLMKNGLHVLKDLTKEERYKIYSSMSYKSGLIFKKTDDKEIELYFRDSEEFDEEETEEEEEEEESEEEEEEKEEKEDESFYSNVLYKVNDKYNKVCNLFIASCGLNILFYLLIITTDPVRLIQTTHCFA